MKVFCACLALAAFAATLTSAAPHDADEPTCDTTVDEDDNKIFSGIVGEKYRWPRGVFVYNFNGTFTSDERSAVRTAMSQITRLTATTRSGIPLPCITFRQSTRWDQDVVQISNYEDKCSSKVGRHGGNQTLMLAASCFRKGKTWGTLAHEMIHALGFHHEQCRPDRDTYIEVLTDNIKKDGLHNYDIKNNTETYSLPYDYSSIMHYRSTEYSKDSKTLKTMKSIPEGKEDLMGQRDTLSNCDIAKIRLMYNCMGRTEKPTECKA